MFIHSYHGVGHVPKVRNRMSVGLPVVGVATGGHFLTAPIGNVKGYDFAHYSKLG